MSVTNACECCCRGGLSTTPSPSRLFFRSAPLLSAALSPPEVRFPKFLPSSPTFFTSLRLSHDHVSSNPGALLYSQDKERAQRILSSRYLGILKHSILTKNASSRRSPIRSAAGEEATGRVDGDSTSDCLYLKRTIRNGEIVEHSGTVIILGDVEPGGHVLADGDVIVLGRLQGHVHAGRAGGAIISRIFAVSIESEEIRICDSALFSPDDNDQIQVPQMAVATDCSIRVFPEAEEAAENQTVTVNRTGMSQTVQTKKIRGLRNQRPAQVALVTGIYISVAGIALLGFPKALFGILFDLKGVKLGWVRVGAILAVVFGVYYIGTAVGDIRDMNGAEAFYLSTVVGRTFLFFSFSILVLMGAVPRPLLLVGAVNFVGAMVMLTALLRSPAQSSGQYSGLLFKHMFRYLYDSFIKR